MSKDSEVTRRDFLTTSTKAGVGLAALSGAGLIERLQSVEPGGSSAQHSPEPAVGSKATWPQEYSVERDEASGRLVLSTPYYSIHHDLKKGGAITQVSYTHGAAPNLLLAPIETSIDLAAEKALPHITNQAHPRPPASFSDLHDSSPLVSVTRAGKFQTVNVQSTLRAPDGRDIGVRTNTTYRYRWGYIKIRKEFDFPEEHVNTSGITVLSTTLDPSLTHYGHRPGAFDNARLSPFSIEPLQWGKLRAGSYFDPPFYTRYIPCHMLFANPGIEGMEWFVADDLGRWYYQVASEPGAGFVTLSVGTDPPGINLRISPLALPSRPDLNRGGFIPLAGTIGFDYYIGLTVLDGRALTRWLDGDFRPNRGQWVSDDEIRQNGENGLVTMTLHNDGDVDHDGLFWRDGTYPPYPPDQMKKMEHVIETCHQFGIKALPYFSNHELHQSTQAYKEHGEEWGRKPDDQGNLRPEYYFGSHMCFKSGWKEFFQSYVDTVSKHQPWDGIYYDWNMALYCNNPLHAGKSSTGVSDTGGLAAYSFSPTGHWDVDEFLEVMEWTRDRVGPDGLVTLHNTGVPMFAAENFADYVCSMEWGYGKLRNDVPKPAQLPLEWNLAGCRSRSILEDSCLDPDAPPRIRRLFRLTCLITGTALDPVSEEAAEMYKVLAPLGNLERFHFEDWRTRVIKLEGQDLVSAVYSRLGEAYILIANFQSQSRQVNCSVNLQALHYPLSGLRAAALVDRGRRVNLNSQRLVEGGEKISLPPDGCRLVWLQG